MDTIATAPAATPNPAITAPSATVIPTNGNAPYAVAPNQVNTGTQDSPVIVTADQAAATHAANSSSLDQILGTISASLPSTGSVTGNSAQNDQDAIAAAKAAQASVSDPGYADPYTQALDQMSSTANLSTQNVIAGLKTGLQNQTNALNDSTDRYSRGLELLGIENNSAQATPDLFLGQQYQVQQESMKKIQDLNTAEQSAVMEAQNARDQGNLSLMTEKMNYVKGLQDQKTAALKDLQATQQADLSNYGSIAKEVAPYVYQALSAPGLTDDQKVQVLQAVSQKYGGIPLDMLTSEVASVKAASDKTAYGVAEDQKKDAIAAQNADTAAAKAEKTAAKSTSGTAAITKTDIASLQQLLSSTTPVNPTTGQPDPSSSYSVSANGFTDPYVYQKAYQQWAAKGGTTKAFLAAFPPADYVSSTFAAPAGYPAYLLPAKAKSTTTSGRKS